jgi:hypothetical protein
MRGFWLGLLGFTALLGWLHSDCSPALDSALAPALPDTGLALITGAAEWTAPTALRVWPDSVLFGDTVWLILDFPRQTTAIQRDSLTSTADWLVWDDQVPVQGPAGPLGRLLRFFSGWRRKPQWPRQAELPEPEGTRIGRRARILNPGPVCIGWGPKGQPRASLTVMSRLDAGQQAAPIRPPRSLGWSWQMLAALLAGMLVVSGLVWRLGRRRRRRTFQPPDAEIPAPAHLQSALDMWRLHSEQLPEQGRGGLFMDRLAAIMRQYLVAHYRIGAQQMTAGEVGRALVARGHSRAEAEAFAGLLQTCDQQRYGPTAITSEQCRTLLSKSINLLAQVKVDARFTPVPAKLAIDGDLCWSRLRELVQSWAGSHSAIALTGGRP